MTDNEKLDALAEVFEADALSPEMALDELGWDSMAMLSVIALARANGKAVAGGTLRELKTIGDILNVL